MSGVWMWRKGEESFKTAACRPVRKWLLGRGMKNIRLRMIGPWMVLIFCCLAAIAMRVRQALIPLAGV